jgi:hypothetical protein
MTAIVGLVDKGTVYIGGDSAGVGGMSLTVRNDSKVFRTGPFVMGFTTSFRMGQLLRYSLQVPRLPENPRKIEAFMVTEFIPAVRRTLKDGGWATKEKEQEAGGTFLVGVGGRLFQINSDYQVGEASIGYDAVGCGEDLALGALFASGHVRNPRNRVRLALRAAERFSAGVRGPFKVVSA